MKKSFRGSIWRSGLCVAAGLITGFLSQKMMAQSTPLTRELQQEAGAASAQDVLDQANLRAAIEASDPNSAQNRLQALFQNEPRNGFEAYAHSQYQLWSRASRGGGPGIHGYSSNPYQNKGSNDVLALLRSRYEQLPPDQRASFDAPYRKMEDASAAHPSGGWLSDQIYGSGSKKTVAESQAAAVRKYPALGTADSPMNREFIARVTKYRAEKSALFNDPSWPEKVARESATALIAGTTISSQ